MMHRRDFLATAGLALTAAGCSSSVKPEGVAATAFANRTDALRWFQDAKFGMFLHYGLYSQMGEGEWVQLRKPVPLDEYEKLKDRFTADAFDADRIAELAQAAGMKYVNLTARHHDSFCLFKTNQTDYSSMNAPCGRDLIGELHAACKKRGLGIFFYYSYALDWRHPYFFSREASMQGPVAWNAARPPYDPPEPRYLYKAEADFKNYIDFVHAQLRELLTQYPDVNGIWLDPIMGYYSRPDLFPIAETYQMMRELQPNCLISFKQGANGEEDFIAPERTPRAHQLGGELAAQVWEKNKNKPIEICDTLQHQVWGYNSNEDGKHKTADEVMKMLDYASTLPANLLLNSGPLGSGAIPEEDVTTLREVGERRSRKD
ncbi:MAG: alpha-L-fucosidase [Bryobacterales bacterium]|nr:alpha-L-fucosidase [Bryobacterales bacterium]